MSSYRIVRVSCLLSLRPVLPAGLEHDTVMDQKTPDHSAALHLLPQVAGHLTLEGIDLRGVVLPVTAMKRFPLCGRDTA
jgi:hypothetical protein